MANEMQHFIRHQSHNAPDHRTGFAQSDSVDWNPAWRLARHHAAGNINMAGHHIAGFERILDRGGTQTRLHRLHPFALMQELSNQAG